MLLTHWLACAEEAPAPTEGTPSPTCAELAPDAALELDPDGPDTQIHVDAAFDGTLLWLAWNRPDDAGLFDVWVAAIDCGGTVQVPPTQVDDSDHNEIDPALAVSGDRVLVTWQSDNGGYPDNLDVRWRVLDGAGAPLGPVSELDGQGNAWMPTAAPAGAGFVIAGVHAPGAVFEVFTLALDADGLPAGPISSPGLDPGSGQSWPAVAHGDDGTWLAFEDETGVTLVPPDGEPETWEGVAPSLSLDGAAPWLAYGDETGDLWLARPGEDGVAVRSTPALDLAPSVAATDDGGFLAWYTNQGGLANEVKVGRFDLAGELLDTVDLGTATAAPYGLRVVHVGGDTVFVGWSEGESPAFRAWGRFVHLSG